MRSGTEPVHAWDDIYGTESLQVADRGRLRWEANDPGCLVVTTAGPGSTRFPFDHSVTAGDSLAFAPRGSVSIPVTDFAGSPSCELQARVRGHRDRDPVR